MDYIKFCEEMCIPKKSTTRYPNDKPWFDGSVDKALRSRDMAFKRGDNASWKQAKYAVRKTISDAKRRYQGQLEDSISSTNSKEMWKSFNKMTGYKPKSVGVTSNDPLLPDQLNEFYASFDRLLDRATMPCSDDLLPPFQVSLDDTRRVLSKLNERKAPGPDGISSRLLRSCKNELCDILCIIFNWSLKVCHVPKVFKHSFVIPVPKRTPVCLNDY